EAPLHLADDLRRVVEARAKSSLGTLRQVAALAHPLVHLGGEGGELLYDGLTLLAECLAELSTERVELLLHEEEGCGGRALVDGGGRRPGAGGHRHGGDDRMATRVKPARRPPPPHEDGVRDRDDRSHAASLLPRQHRERQSGCVDPPSSPAAGWVDVAGDPG